jgi:hypothetical protein
MEYFLVSTSMGSDILHVPARPQAGGVDWRGVGADHGQALLKGWL